MQLYQQGTLSYKHRHKQPLQAKRAAAFSKVDQENLKQHLHHLENGNDHKAFFQPCVGGSIKPTMIRKNHPALPVLQPMAMNLKKVSQVTDFL